MHSRLYCQSWLACTQSCRLGSRCQTGINLRRLNTLQSLQSLQGLCLLFHNPAATPWIEAYLPKSHWNSHSMICWFQTPHICSQCWTTTEPNYVKLNALYILVTYVCKNPLQCRFELPNSPCLDSHWHHGQPLRRPSTPQGCLDREVDSVSAKNMKRIG